MITVFLPGCLVPSGVFAGQSESNSMLQIWLLDLNKNNSGMPEYGTSARSFELAVSWPYHECNIPLRFLQKVQNLDLKIYESNAGIGGTWYVNKYPVRHHSRSGGH